MMRTALACSAAVAVLLTAGAASAQEAPEVAWNLGVTSDYVFRGYSQTSEDPAIFGGVDVTAGNFYAGAWASNVDFGDDTEAEFDIYGGYRTEVSGFAVDVGVVGYLYVSQPGGADYDYAEFKAAASRAIGPVTLGAAVYWSPDFFGVDEEATYVEANAAFSPAPPMDGIGSGRAPGAGRQRRLRHLERRRRLCLQRQCRDRCPLPRHRRNGSAVR